MTRPRPSAAVPLGAAHADLRSGPKPYVIVQFVPREVARAWCRLVFVYASYVAYRESKGVAGENGDCRGRIVRESRVQ